jgi:7-carboxy-7-deazaguanine synthase
VKTQLPIELSELFFSIQGESSFAGSPCVFIRLAGCNLRCSYCDAKYTYEEESSRKNIPEILTYVDSFKPFPVEITGGEPLLQENVYPLMDELLSANRKVLLETNGSINLGRVPPEVVKIMDIKCPGSGMADQFLKENLGLLTPADEIKFVLTSRADYEWAKATLIEADLSNRNTIHFSPVPRQLAATDLADWLLDDQLPVRLQLQLHKILWPDEERGV